MKKLRITVNNRVYDVVVQVLEDDGITAVEGPTDPRPLPIPATIPVTASSTPVRVAPTGAAPAAPAPGQKPAAPEAGAILAPIAGTVQKVFVQPGDHIEAKAPVCLLDAMKMDTYVYAPNQGTVAEIHVRAGDTVQVGDTILRLTA